MATIQTEIIQRVGMMAAEDSRPRRRRGRERGIVSGPNNKPGREKEPDGLPKPKPVRERDTDSPPKIKTVRLQDSGRLSKNKATRERDSACPLKTEQVRPQDSACPPKTEQVRPQDSDFLLKPRPACEQDSNRTSKTKLARGRDSKCQPKMELVRKRISKFPPKTKLGRESGPDFAAKIKLGCEDKSVPDFPPKVKSERERGRTDPVTSRLARERALDDTPKIKPRRRRAPGCPTKSRTVRERRQDNLPKPELACDKGLDGISTSKTGCDEEAHDTAKSKLGDDGESVVPVCDSIRGNTQTRRCVDLTGILSLSDRAQLESLTDSILEQMVLDLSATFDCLPVTSASYEFVQFPIHESVILLDSSTPVPDNETGTQFDVNNMVKPDNTGRKGKPKKTSTRLGENGNNKTAKASLAPNVINQVLVADVNTCPLPAKKEQQEAMVSQLSELKKDLLGHFRKWQVGFEKRVRDILVNDPISARPSRITGRGVRGIRGARGMGSRRRGPRAGSYIRGGLTLQTCSGFLEIPEHEVAPVLPTRHSPVASELGSLSISKRKTVLHSMILLMLSLEDYTSFSRKFLIRLTSSLDLPLQEFHAYEVEIGKCLGAVAAALPSDETIRKIMQENKAGNKGKISLAAVLHDVVGGMAAPLLAAGIGNIEDGLAVPASTSLELLGRINESGAILGSIFGIYGARMTTTKCLEKFGREVQDFAFVPLQSNIDNDNDSSRLVLPGNRRLRLFVGLGGWTVKEDDHLEPWRCIGDQAEGYALRWESLVLSNLGNALETITKTSAWGFIQTKFKATASETLRRGSWPLGLLKVSKIVDNAWCAGLVRAERAGLALADGIIKKVQGNRPISLIGYGLGARAIYTCLMILAERRQFGLIDSVAMIGAPAPSEGRVWVTLKSVVIGRLVNVYAESDYLLAFFLRTCNRQFGVAGLEAIQGAEGVENFSVSDLGCGHLRYQYMLSSILTNIGWEDVNMAQVERDKIELARLDQLYHSDKGPGRANANVKRSGVKPRVESKTLDTKTLLTELGKLSIQNWESPNILLLSRARARWVWTVVSGISNTARELRGGMACGGVASDFTHLKGCIKDGGIYADTRIGWWIAPGQYNSSNSMLKRRTGIVVGGLRDAFSAFIHRTIYSEIDGMEFEHCVTSARSEW